MAHAPNQGKPAQPAPPALPDAQQLAQYDQIMPGAAKAIIDAFTNQGNHRRTQEHKIVDANIDEVKRGQQYALAIGITALVAACVCAAFGAYTAASVIGGTTLVSVVGSFLVKREA